MVSPIPHLDEVILISITFNMNTISFTEACENLASTMDKVCSEHMPVMITRNDNEPVVMLSLEDFESSEESAFLLREPAVAERLLEGIRALESVRGGVREKNLKS